MTTRNLLRAVALAPVRLARLEFGRFVLVGAAAAAVNIASRVVFSLFVSYEVAIVLAFGCGLTSGFILNRVFVFQPSSLLVYQQAWRFTVVNLAALVQVFVVTLVLRRYVFPALGYTLYADTVAHAAGVLSPIFTSYLGHKWFTFKR